MLKHLKSYLPPRAPYIRIRVFTLGEKVDRKKAVAAQALPAIATARQPNLLARAPATGPGNLNKNIKLLKSEHAC